MSTKGDHNQHYPVDIVQLLCALYKCIINSKIIKRTPYLLYARCRNMSIDLSRPAAGMTKQFLDIPYASPRFQQMSGITVP